MNVFPFKRWHNVLICGVSEFDCVFNGVVYMQNLSAPFMSEIYIMQNHLKKYLIMYLG